MKHVGYSVEPISFSKTVRSAVVKGLRGWSYNTDYSGYTDEEVLEVFKQKTIATKYQTTCF